MGHEVEVIIRGYCIKLARLVCGYFISALGAVLTIQANIGLAPWDAFTMGCSYVMHVSYGQGTIITGIAILAADWLLKEKIGFGTILNALLIGAFVDLILSLHVIPQMHSFWPALPMLLCGHLLICIGSYYYISAGMGCGPRDSLFVALCKRMPRVRVGIVRGGLEGTALLCGWLLGAKVGAGTIISVAGIGALLELTFKFYRFDVKAVRHEDIRDTLKKFTAD